MERVLQILLRIVITWIGLGNSVFSTNGNAVAYNGELWVAVESGINSTIAYSSNGLNWTGLGKTIFVETSSNSVFDGNTRDYDQQQYNK